MSELPKPDCRYRLALLDANQGRLITEWFGESERAKALTTFRIKERTWETGGYAEEVCGLQLEDVFARTTMAMRFRPVTDSVEK